MRTRRHTLEVLVDKLGDVYEKYWDRFDDADRQAISRVRRCFDAIVDQDSYDADKRGKRK
jgi:hypothetical protein